MNETKYDGRDLTQPIEDCVACDGTGQCAMVYDGVVGIETCDICGGSGVDR